MATGLTAAGANTELAALVAAYPYIKLHVGDPGAAMTANAAVETTRKQITWAAPSGGSIASSVDAAWSAIAGSEDATHFSGWSAGTGGTAGYSGAITANPYTAGDAYVVPAGGLTLTHTLAS